jgi:hypothetical protein
VLNLVVLQYIEIESGKALTSLMEERTGITSRTWTDGGPKRRKAQARADASSREFLRDKLVTAGWSKQADRLIAEHPQSEQPAALYAGLVYGAQYPGFAEFPETLALARVVDRASTELWHARRACNLVAFCHAADLTSDIEQALGPRVCNLVRLREARNWDTADDALRALTMDVLVSLLATWDVELCRVFFTGFEARPIFSLLLPHMWQLAPTAESKHRRHASFRHPTRRLIDLTTCFAHYVRHCKWPSKPTGVKQLAGLTGKTEQRLKDWRRGRLFTRRDYEHLWESCCRRPREKQTGVPVPMPLYIATTMWHMTLLDESAPGLSPNFIERAYVAAWQLRLREERAKGRTFGRTAWPACVNQV